MTKENAKDYLPFVQALAEGKDLIVNCGSEMADSWEVYTDNMGSLDAFPIEFIRIKPEPEYVSFDSVEELIEGWSQKKYNGKATYDTKLNMPIIWVKAKALLNNSVLITAFWKTDVFICNHHVSLDRLFENYTFLDGSPVGKIKE